MAGDTVSIWGKSYYHLNGGQTATNTYAVSSALLSLLTSFAGGTAVAGKGVTGATLNANTPTTTPLTSFVNGNPNPTGNTTPKAGVNWILFDEQFRPVANGYDAVNSAGDYVKTHTMIANVTTNGYLYMYCSDESQVDVYFDNLQVMHNRGPLLEETHYYPFGLTMAGISSKALGFGDPSNKKKFTSQLLDDDLGWNTYQMKWRTMDPQIGRFLQVDPLASKYVYNTTYAYAENRVINGIDLEGLEFAEKISSQNCTKQWDITIKVVNRSSDTKESIADAAIAIKTTMENTMKGQDADGYNVTTCVDMEVTDQSNVHYSTDLVMEFNDGKFRDGATFEKNNIVGSSPRNQTDKGLIEIIAPKVMSEKNPSTTPEKNLASIAEAGTHEVGHSGGLLHVNDPRNPKSIKEAYKNPATREAYNYNLMQPSVFSSHLPVLLPEQLSQISNTITNKTKSD